MIEVCATFLDASPNWPEYGGWNIEHCCPFFGDIDMSALETAIENGHCPDPYAMQDDSNAPPLKRRALSRIKVGSSGRRLIDANTDVEPEMEADDYFDTDYYKDFDVYFKGRPQENYYQVWDKVTLEDGNKVLQPKLRRSRAALPVGTELDIHDEQQFYRPPPADPKVCYEEDQETVDTA